MDPVLISSITDNQLIVLMYISAITSAFALFIHRGEYSGRYRSQIGRALIDGVIALVLAGLVNTLVYSTFQPSYIILVSIIGPIVEESIKAYFVVQVIKKFKKPNTMDGFIVGGFVGLGFGAIEDLIYAFRAFPEYDVALMTLVFRGGTAIIRHVLFTAIFGYFFVLDKYNPNRGIIIAISLHGLWNYFSATNIIFTFVGLILVLLLIVIYVYFRNNAKANKRAFAKKKINN